MQDFLQITTILLAVLALGISKRRVQKGFTSLSDTEKKYYHSQFKRIRLVQYSVVFLVVISSILITGGHLSGENSYFVFTLSFAALIFGSFYTYRLIRKES
ncbi:MAG: hypothetical protein OEZ34_08090, partial [Spirochaetia bacterium]|nr:hypothetical protein [Spirochaetia bacterium]